VTIPKRDPYSVGGMRDRVTIQTRTESVSPNGEKVLSWATADTVWACVQESSGSETVGSRLTQAETVLTVTIRWHAAAVPKARIVFDGAVADIDSAINPDGRKRFLTLTCRRRES
jgi:SPP1 family predicted phage head-tail adaptor